jgi:hypothetical protein
VILPEQLDIVSVIISNMGWQKMIMLKYKNDGESIEIEPNQSRKNEGGELYMKKESLQQPPNKKQDKKLLQITRRKKTND